MSENINLNETYELVSNKELSKEIIVNVNGNKITLESFASDYQAINGNITDLCIKAHYLASKDRATFMEYVTKTMGLSRTSAVQMINAGDIYVETVTKLLPVSYTKVAELTPVKEQLTEYSDFIGGFENLYDKTQKEIRESVKAFTNDAQEQLTNLDDDETTEDETSDTESGDTESGEVVITDVTTDYLEIKGTVEMIKAYLSEFTDADREGVIIDKYDVRLCRAFIGNLDLLMSRVRSIIKEGCLSYTDYDTVEEREVNFE